MFRAPQIRLASLVLTMALAYGAGVPAGAAAACSPAQRADTIASLQIVALMQRDQSVGVGDAAALVSRSRSRCDTARYARAAVSATRVNGLPQPGSRVRALGVDLIATTSGRATVWRLDTVRIASRSTSASTPQARAAARAQLLAAATGTHVSLAWADDPTRPRWDAVRQSSVVAMLARSRTPADRSLMNAGVRAFAVPSRLNALQAQSVLDQLRVANRVALASAFGRSASTIDAARAVGIRALLRTRAARSGSWTRIDDRWATIAQHRAIVSQARALIKRVPHPASEPAISLLERTLITAPRISFNSLPTASFYPWPRDGSLDSQTVDITIDKPAMLRLHIYGPDDQVIRSIDQSSEPGRIKLSWDGASADGTIQPAERYRYNIDALDLAGNRIRVPGLDAFAIDRDAAAPSVQVAKVSWSERGADRRIIVSWQVRETLSPSVRTFLLLQRGADRRTMQLHDSLQRATVRRSMELPRGVWTTTLVFVDGSGNRARRSTGEVVVR